MSRRSSTAAVRRILCPLFALACAAPLALADTGLANAWRAAYPSSTSDDAVVASTGTVCALCHFTPTDGTTWNAYGWKMREELRAGQSVAAAMVNVEALDSDLDPAGWVNSAEIARGAQPGWTPGPNNTRYEKTGVVPNQPPPATLVVVLDPPCGQVASYCTAGTTSNGCVPAISGAGTPSASAPSGFTISIANVEGQRPGNIFYGVSGALATPWSAGSSSFLCVSSPTQRTGNRPTGGTYGACDGALSIDWNAYVDTHPGALGQPFTGGETVWVQGWFRDPPAPKTTNLSDALQFTVCP